MAESARDITTLLNLTGKDPEAEDRLFRLVEARFRRIAGAKMRHERDDHTLQPTVLVDDAFMRLVRNAPQKWKNREQFFCMAAKQMRQLLVDYARQKCAEKRGKGEPKASLEDLGEPMDQEAIDPADLLAIHDAVEKLENDYPEVFKVFDLHFIAAFSLKEIAEDILAVNYDTAKSRWRMAKAFLHR